jgi:hypothetical protein
MRVSPKDANKGCLQCRVRPVAGGAAEDFCAALFCSRGCELDWVHVRVSILATPLPTWDAPAWNTRFGKPHGNTSRLDG